MATEAGYRPEAVTFSETDEECSYFRIHSGSLNVASVSTDGTHVAIHVAIGSHSINLCDPNSQQEFLTELKKAWKHAMKESAWKFFRISTFSLAVAILVIWACIRMSCGEVVNFTRSTVERVYQAGESFDLDTSVKRFDQAIASINVDEDTKTTTIFWIEDASENVEIYRNQLIEWRARFAEVAARTNEMPMREAKQECSVLMKEFRDTMPGYPTGLGIYPYNRLMFWMFLFGVAFLGTTLYWNRKWFV